MKRQRVILKKEKNRYRDLRLQKMSYTGNGVVISEGLTYKLESPRQDGLPFMFIIYVPLSEVNLQHTLKRL